MTATATAAAGEQTVALAAEAATAPLIADLGRQLLDLDRQIKDLDRQITARADDHPHTARITSVPGFGPLLAAYLLVFTGGNLAAAFVSPGRLAAYAGLAPVPRDSGRIHGSRHRPKRDHRGLRRVFYMAALSTIRPGGSPRLLPAQTNRG